MTLTTHALVGAAAASLFPQHPYAAFAAGFVSHLAADALPHWQEGAVMLRSLQKLPDGTHDMPWGRDFGIDLLYLGGMTAAGVLLSILIFTGVLQVPLAIVLIGAAAGLLPDFFHFVYFKTRTSVLTDFERFHSRIQTEKSDKRYLGVEAALVLCAIIVVSILR
jgi:hypothetical protein